MAEANENKLTSFMLISQIGTGYLTDWTLEDLESPEGLDSLMDAVATKLSNEGGRISEMYAVLHDEDFAKAAGAEAVSIPVVPHVHIVGRFKRREKGLTEKRIIDAIEGDSNDSNDSDSRLRVKSFNQGRLEFEGGSMLVKADKGRWAFDNMLAYLIHAKDADKHQYDASRVRTYAACGCEPYSSIVESRIAKWREGRAVKTHLKAKRPETVSSLEQSILDGGLRRGDLLLNDDYYRTYSRNARRLDEALRVADDRRMLKSAEALRAGEFTKSVIFVDGVPGTGKTVFLKAVCRFLKTRLKWFVCALAAKNALDDYDGSEVVLMDDVREGAMSAEDWLRFIDPHNASRGSARYHNTESIAPRVILISSNKPPFEFFFDARGVSGAGRSEAVDTFFRRLTMQMHFGRPDDGWSYIQILAPTLVEGGYLLKPPEESSVRKRRAGELNLDWRLDVVEGCDALDPYGAAAELVKAIYGRNRKECERAERDNWTDDEPFDMQKAESDSIAHCAGVIYDAFMPAVDGSDARRNLDHMPALYPPGGAAAASSID